MIVRDSLETSAVKLKAPKGNRRIGSEGKRKKKFFAERLSTKIKKKLGGEHNSPGLIYHAHTKTPLTSLD